MSSITIVGEEENKISFGKPFPPPPKKKLSYVPSQFRYTYAMDIFSFDRCDKNFCFAYYLGAWHRG